MTDLLRLALNATKYGISHICKMPNYLGSKEVKA